MILLRDVGPMEARFGSFETVLILTQDRYTIWAKHAIGSEIVLAHLLKLLGVVGQMKGHLVCLEIVLMLVQDRCSVCTEHTIVLEISLDPPNGTPT
jgi:hypothetical protein